ncbi:tyrosine-type recombinase/integrase [Vibrio owensii]|uniref:tyrosine-type recombinase/integrase n=1 Tax=Vibrio owensii TaxID=696485 RepID=UPI003CC5F3FF
MSNYPKPVPYFDSFKYFEEGNSIVNQHIASLSVDRVPDASATYELIIDWLSEQKDSNNPNKAENNYKTYRSELTTFLYFCWDYEGIKIEDVDRRVMYRYMDFCAEPPAELIGYHNTAQFKEDKATGLRAPNPDWRLFRGKKVDSKPIPYQLSSQASRTKLAILSAFFSFLIDAEYTERNPASMLLKKSRFKSKASNVDSEDFTNIMSELQWSYVIGAAEAMADEKPSQHERSLFLMSLMYSCYLRISEISSRPGFSPVMSQFRQDPQTGVWSYYIPMSKGQKARSVAVSNDMLKALRRYRRFLGLSDLPSPKEQTPLVTRIREAKKGKETGIVNANLGIRQVREIIYQVFSKAADMAMEDGMIHDSHSIREMSPHALRHTGISHDVNQNERPLTHVRDDAGHDSLDTTSKYIHTSRVERHQTARDKEIDRLKEDVS